MTTNALENHHAWWSRLRHQGLLLSPVVLLERYPGAPQIPPFYVQQRARDAHTRFQAVEESSRQAQAPQLNQNEILRWTDRLIEDYFGHSNDLYLRSHAIPKDLTASIRIGSRSETIRPHRILYAGGQSSKPALLLMADTSPQVGRGRGRTAYSRFLELLRGTGHRLGLLTNGRQFRLIYAGLDFESWAEWESERWFDDAEGSQELAGLRQLLHPDSLALDEKSGQPRLLQAVEESRRRQADLSGVLRENVRLAVEYILEDLSAKARENPALLDAIHKRPASGEGDHDGDLTDADTQDALLQATVRIVMRIVVCLFAESRQLLPLDHPVYAQSYSARTLYELLEQRVREEGGTHGLFNSRSAWPRLTALFRLIHDGSAHHHFSMRPYSGTLFRPGDPVGSDPVSRALHVLEQDVPVCDATIRQVLRKLLRGPLPVMRGRVKTFVEGPVDYTDLRTEFIGLIYEGLLDYRLRQADETVGPQVFLNIGQEPVLPLERLEQMLEHDKRGLTDLFTKLKKEKASSIKGEEEEGESDQEEEEAEAEEPEVVHLELEGEPEEAAVEESEEEPFRPADFLDADSRAKRWAQDAVVLLGLVGKKKAREPESEYRKRIEAEARSLIKRVIATGEFYLVRSNATRKGTGTFYTPPQLAIPTVHRTLKPLCYNESGVPRTPREILSLKVCDPACGSASFLVAAVHYLTRALYDSLRTHCGIEDTEKLGVVTLPFGEPPTPHSELRTPNSAEPLPFPPNDPQRGHEFEERVKAILRRHVVERCLYGVDINPLAVELARVSLWVETMDRELPFTFLDHKIKVGNSLVGCWLDRFQDYPLAAWLREGGDGKDGPRTGLIKARLRGSGSGQGLIKLEMEQVILTRYSAQMTFLEDFHFDPASIVNQARAEYERLHDLPVADLEERERHYREKILGSPAISNLKAAMDEWCSIWFWPVDAKRLPLCPTPRTFHRLPEEGRQIVRQLAADMRFFHWELEFPDVFTRERNGFDAMIGNPPWEVMKPNSHEFFTQYDPIYRTYDKQAALRRQETLFGIDSDIEERWMQYSARFKALSNWVKCVADSFSLAVDLKTRQRRLGLVGGKADQLLAEFWGKARQRHALDIGIRGKIPFRYQGSADLNSYKLFLELAYQLLHDDGADREMRPAASRLGLIVPSGLYTDSGTAPLRRLFLEESTWDWLFSFENKKKIFDIHGSYKFGPVIIERRKGDRPLKAAFMVHDLTEWDKAEPEVFEYDLSLIPLFSPRSRSLPEVRTRRDLEICRKIYEHSIRIGDRAPGWEIEYAREFDMTNDSKHFKPKEWWEERGYRPDVFGRWIQTAGIGQLGWKLGNDGFVRPAVQNVEPFPGDRIALPLYEGRMIGQFDFSQKGWVSGKGRSAKWREIPFSAKAFEPQYCMGLTQYREMRSVSGLRMAFMDISSATNARTMICCVHTGFPFGNSAPLLFFEENSVRKPLLLSGTSASLATDYAIRQRTGGLHLNWFIAGECPIPESMQSDSGQFLILLDALRLTFIHRHFAPEWLATRNSHREVRLFNSHSDKMERLAQIPWKHLWSVTEADRLRRRVEIDALCADLYGLAPDDFDWIVRDDPSDPKGFWRVEKHLPFDERLTGLAAMAFRALKDDRWTAETALTMSNDEFFETIGAPYITQPIRDGRPAILKRQGCHDWRPELFAEDDFRYGWTWEHCEADARALLGGQEAVDRYLKEQSKE